MSLVGKKFPNITVDAMSEMGDNLRINILEEATKKNKKVVLSYVLLNYTLSKSLRKNSKNATLSS